MTRAALYGPLPAETHTQAFRYQTGFFRAPGASQALLTGFYGASHPCVS
jgi:hypothetical protein